MLASRNILWSEQKFSLIELLHSSHSPEYPLLVKVVESHYGSPTEDNCDPEETFVFYGWGKQERVLAENANKVSISIPTSHEHKLSLSVYDPKRSKHNVTLPLSSIVTLYLPPVRAEFDPSVESIFYVGSNLYSSKDFGSMLLKSSHLLEYVNCSPISKGKINKDALHVLPTSLSLTFSAAKGLRNNVDLGTVLKGVQNEASFLMGTSVDHQLLGICGYCDLMPEKDGNYDFIDIIRAGSWPPTVIESCPDETEQTQYEIPVPSHRPVPPRNPREPPPIPKRPDKGQRKLDTTAHGGVRGKRITSLEDVPEDISSLSVQEVCDCLCLLKLDTHVQQFTDKLVDGRLLLICNTVDFQTEFGFTAFRAHQLERFVKDGWRPKMSGVTDRRITSFENIPEDISSMSVQEVCDCLHLLKLDNYVQCFTDYLVDGCLLLTCSTDDLQTEFGFTTFRARQMEQFLKDGWRPKMNSEDKEVWTSNMNG